MGELHTAVAQVFNERGDGVVVRGGTAKISKADLRPHLGEADAHKLLSDALGEYRRTHGHQPARIVLHKTSQFSPAEVTGFQGAADDRDILPGAADILGTFAVGDAATDLRVNRSSQRGFERTGWIAHAT